MPTLKKSLIDNRQYKYLELDNKMKVILVSDPDSQKSAASVNVGVGSFSDPVELTARETSPKAEFQLPSVLDANELLPTAVLLIPVVLEKSANSPIAVR